MSRLHRASSDAEPNSAHSHFTTDDCQLQTLDLILDILWDLVPIKFGDEGHSESSKEIKLVQKAQEVSSLFCKANEKPIALMIVAFDGWLKHESRLSAWVS